MSKKKLEGDSEILEVLEETQDQPIIVKNATTKVKSKIDGPRFIGNTWYNFEKDGEIMVPTNVAEILRTADAIYW